MTLYLNISPCPNDTFMFDALVNGAINLDGINFDLHFADIEKLNTQTIKNIPDISKISFGAYPLVAKNYQLLTSGSALGFGVGPLLISKSQLQLSNIYSCKVALPGQHTTANLLFDLAFPNAKNKCFMLFSKIEEAIAKGEVDAGVIIHESRFTYQNKGLYKIADLGACWEKTTGLPVPLGGIVVRRSFPDEIKYKINSLLHQSVELSLATPNKLSQFVQEHAQEISSDVQKAHIALYVNRYSINLDEVSQKAIEKLIDPEQKLNLGSIFI